MKKYKEAKEERSIYCVDLFLACLSIYLRPNRRFKYTENFTMPGVLPETFCVSNTYCLLTHSSPCFPSISNHVGECSV